MALPRAMFSHLLCCFLGLGVLGLSGFRVWGGGLWACRASRV